MYSLSYQRQYEIERALLESFLEMWEKLVGGVWEGVWGCLGVGREKMALATDDSIVLAREMVCLPTS